MVMSGGRFAGPLISGAATRIASPLTNSLFCEPLLSGTDGGISCGTPATQDAQCFIEGVSEVAHLPPPMSQKNVTKLVFNTDKGISCWTLAM